MERLDPRVRLVWAGGALVTAAVLGSVLVVGSRFVGVLSPAVGIGGFLLVALVGGAHAVARYRIWRFDLRKDALYLERGVLTRVRTVAPYVRVQHVDSRRGPLERLAGLASVVVYTAGSRGADVTIPGLSPDRAEVLREQLRELAIESEGEDAV